MPNHIQNRLEVLGTPKQVKAALNFISSTDKEGKEVQIDFDPKITLYYNSTSQLLSYKGKKTYIYVSK